MELLVQNVLRTDPSDPNIWQFSIRFGVELQKKKQEEWMKREMAEAYALQRQIGDARKLDDASLITAIRKGRMK